MSADFGAFAPSPYQERVRALGARLPVSWLGRKAASLLLGAAGARARRAYDVAVFGSQRARLHPFDNICEKRVYLTPQLWDGEERAMLARQIANHPNPAFFFVDVGANVGLYSLFARAECAKAGKRLSAVAIEADPDMQTRLSFNIAASGAAADIALVPYAASSATRVLSFAVNRASRGESRIASDGALRVGARPLAAIAAEAGLSRIDAMKVDIEGHEAETLGAFFQNAPAGLWPTFAIVEVAHAETGAVEAIFHDRGYAVALKTMRNAVFLRG
jgi:FkbM family methyltransferase